MKPQLYCDIDSTVNNHWVRIQNNSESGRIRPSAFSETEVMKDKPLPGAVETLNWFEWDGWDVHFLSSRNWPDAQRITETWLRQHRFPFKTVNIVQSHEAKIPFLQNHWCDLYVDDFSGGQEFCTGPDAPVFYRNLVDAMPCPYEILRPANPGAWFDLGDKYFRPLLNGEKFWRFALRNLEWWRVNRDHESRTRPPYYSNFASAVGLTRDLLKGKTVGEVGAGPFGGILRWLDADTAEEHFVDVLANAQRVLRFVDWPARCHFHDCPAEKITLTDNALDVLVSFNALDHGWSINAALDEAARVSREFFIAFDCKGSDTPEHDRLDHYQQVYFDRVQEKIRLLRNCGAILEYEMGDLRQRTPQFNFEHNWGFPVFYCHGVCRT